MRIFVIILTLIIGSDIYGQTDSIEKAILYENVLSGKLSNENFSITAKKWTQTVKTNKYPDLPINKDKKIQYSFILEFQDISKEKLFNRILEWFSVAHDIIPSFLYSNLNDGKIICSNSLSITNNSSGIYTYVITIKDGKVLMEFINIGYQVTSGGYYSDGTWVAEKTSLTNIDDLFPIILKDASKWTYYFNILTKIDEFFNGDINSLNRYLIGYDLRYIF